MNLVKRNLKAMYIVDERVHGILEQSNDKLEVGLMAIIRVGHGSVFAIRPQKVGHTEHLALLHLVATQGHNGTIVVTIHHHDEIELFQVALVYLASMAVEPIPMVGSTLPHSWVRQLSYVPSSDASRVDVEFIGQSTLLYPSLHDALGRWRTADIAQAYEQHRMFSFSLTRLIYLCHFSLFVICLNLFSPCKGTKHPANYEVFCHKMYHSHPHFRQNILHLFIIIVLLHAETKLKTLKSNSL